MLRRLVLLLLLANAAFWAWSHGWLTDLGQWAVPHTRHEPHRLLQQVQPDRLRLTDSAAPGVANGTASAEKVPVLPGSATSAAGRDLAEDEATECLQMGVLDDKQLTRLKPVLNEALPPNSWVLETSVQPARWVVYSGKLVNAEALASLRAELRRLKVTFREAGTPALQPGLVLGAYSTESAAQEALRDVTRTGVKGAKVTVERPEVNLHMARLPRATPADKAAALQAVASTSGDPWSGKTFQPCP